MTTPPPLLYDQYYHLFNRGNNRENIFIEERNYLYFMELYVHHIASIADTYAYCLLRNHFHLLVRIKSESEVQTFRVFRNEVSRTEVSKTRKVSSPSLQFGNFFNAYAKAINQAYARTGSLFQKPFGRVLVTDHAHLLYLVRYIHYNPQKHGFVDDYRKWPYSSYPCACLGKTISVATRIDTGLVQWARSLYKRPPGRNRFETDFLLVAG